MSKAFTREDDGDERHAPAEALHVGDLAVRLERH